MIPLLFTPVGRYIALGAILMAFAAGMYFKIRSDAVAQAEARRQKIELERLQNAIRAGDSVDVSPDGLRKPDRFTR